LGVGLPAVSESPDPQAVVKAANAKKEAALFMH
jgi:hypothetical protein